jgi:phosphoglucosamine mutase
VIAIGNQPDGLNINLECGSTHTDALCRAVIEHGADLGIAFDGDGDRVMMVDGNGRLLDGDQLLYIIAMHRQLRGCLNGGVVGTLMTNLALEHALAKVGIPFARAKVGDRYVLELLNQRQWQLGGENSGHILALDKHSSGDGIIAALQVLHAVKTSGKSLAALGAELTLYPQVLINVNVKKRINLDASAELKAAVQAAESELNGSGRVLLRASGTEPKIRVMVEGQSKPQVQALAERIAEVVKAQAH